MLSVRRGAISYQTATNIRPIPTPPGEWVGPFNFSHKSLFGVNLSGWDVERSGERGVSYGRHREVWFTLWLPFLVTMVLPVCWAWSRRKSFAPRLAQWRDRRAGLCLHCGYDLRASPGRCPECGTVRAGAGPSAA